MPLIIFALLVPFALVMQAFTAGHDVAWVAILLLIPVVWAFGYAVVNWLPTLVGSSQVVAACERIEAVINPHKALREAEKRYAVTGSVPSAIALAEQYLLNGRLEEAKTLFQCSAIGPHSDDPDLLLGLANAHFGLHEYQNALDCLDLLKQKHPESTSEEGHLLYAKCLQELGRTGEAIQEFRALASYCSGPEPACRLGLLYKRIGDLRKAYAIFESVLSHSRQMNERYVTRHAEWLNIARNEVRKWAPLQPK